ncbi:MAG: hypothetical protein ABTQ73_13735 [Caldilineales bacterium]
MPNLATEFYPAGGPAPAYTLTAVKSGRTVGNLASKGQVVVLIFHGRETVQAAIEVNTAVRPDFPDPKDVLLASVLDLSIVPRLLQGAVKPMLEQAYAQAAQQIPPGYAAADFVFLLADWKGEVTKAFKIKDTGKQAGVVVIDAAGRVTGSYQGPNLGAATLALVRAAAGR